MITTILFDLDGTLLPMNQDAFLDAYMGSLAKKMAPYGYDPNSLIKNVWRGTAAMVQNNGTLSNEAVFWKVFSQGIGWDASRHEAVFQSYYCEEFQEIAKICGFDPRAAQTVQYLTQSGKRLVLATNPLFPAVATYSRIKWAGLNPEDFAHITTYENASYCKPNPAYYQQILETLNLKPEECLMVGNDVAEDMVAEDLGISVFLLTDCLINKENKDIAHFSHGSFPELMAYLRSL